MRWGSNTLKALCLLVCVLAWGNLEARATDIAYSKVGPSSKKSTSNKISSVAPKRAAPSLKNKNSQAIRRVASSKKPANAPAAVVRPSKRLSEVFAGSASPSSSGNSRGLAGMREVDAPLKVKGQSRNLSMMLVLKAKKDKIKFGEVRESYKDEIMSTTY